MSGFLDWCEDCLRACAIASGYWCLALLPGLVIGALLGAGGASEDVAFYVAFGLPTLLLPWFVYRAWVRVRRASHELASGAAVIE